MMNFIQLSQCSKGTARKLHLLKAGEPAYPTCSGNRFGLDTWNLLHCGCQQGIVIQLRSVLLQVMKSFELPEIVQRL